jgi:predicted AlkP superfamily pyrophosphatase or phosphodiesterase
MRKLCCILFILANISGAGAQATRYNAPEHAGKPHVILISLDGYRWDYTQRFQPPNISALIERGAQAESLISCFPSKTFPSHYTIATGMYPENHGLVNNSFFAPDKGEVFRMSNRRIVQDGSWYEGLPLWVSAEKHGMISASYFFVGSEADVRGVRPTHWFPYDGKVSNIDRVEQVLSWLRMPSAERPHLITLYFSDMDDVGHAYGPNADERLRPALMRLDSVLGVLFRGVEASGLPVYVILVSDHGMAETPLDYYLPIDPYLDRERYQVINNGSLAHLYLNDPSELDSVYHDLRARADKFSVHKVEDFPFFTKNPSNPRLGHLLLFPDYPHYFSDARRIGFLRRNSDAARGEHGFDPRIPDMHGILYLWGPKVKPKLRFPAVESIHIYPLICYLLGLPIPEYVDGRLEVLKGILEE